MKNVKVNTNISFFNDDILGEQKNLSQFAKVIKEDE
jgi:hypothetical protein